MSTQTTLAMKTKRTIKGGVEALVSAAPRYETPPSWVPGLRVLLAFYAPILMGAAIDMERFFIPVGIGAGMLALVDPMGNSIRRAATIAATTIASATVFAIGSRTGDMPGPAILLMFAVVYLAGLSSEFGTAGVRAGLWVVTASIFGISNSGINPGFFSETGMLLGGTWALFLALVPFRNEGAPLKAVFTREAIADSPIERRVRRFARSWYSHLSLDTATGRHALRMAAAVALGLCVSYLLQRPTVGWIAGSTLAVLNPQVRLFRLRSANLLLGTVIGVAAAYLIASSGIGAIGMLLLTAPLIFLAANLRSVDYSAWVTLYSAFTLVMLFISTGDGSDLGLLGAKLLDTGLGAILALIVAWTTFPKSERARLNEEITRDLA